ncbi:neural Wiskott-Aldrich syndrome protein [Salix suchowensis]|nr:neural Wiskott-Aldrich syndrome protein [Salix suchowensis]
MDSIAQMSCMMRVNVHCDGCKRKMMGVLHHLKGVNGKVNPTTILNVFDEYGKHGEVSSLRFDGEVMEQIPYSFYADNPYEVPYPPIPFPYPFLEGYCMGEIVSNANATASASANATASPPSTTTEAAASTTSSSTTAAATESQ